MNRRYPESASGNGGRERSGSPDGYHGNEDLHSRASRTPREEDTSRWTNEGGSQTYYRRDFEDQRGAQQYGGGYASRNFNEGASYGPSNPYGEQYGSGQGTYGYGAQQFNAGANPHQFGGQHGGFYNYGQRGSTSVGGQYAQPRGYGASSGYGGQYGSQQGYGGTAFGNSPNQGYPQSSSPYAGGGGQYGSPPGSSLSSPYGAQPGYAPEYGGGYGSSPLQSWSQQYDSSARRYDQQYGAHAQGYGQQYGGGAGYPPMRGDAAGSQYGGGYGYPYGGGSNYAAGSQYGSVGAYGQGSQANRGRGPKNYSRSTERVREDVCERLSSDPYIDASDIDVNVGENGRIVLEGTVNERWMKHRIEDMIDATPGVQHIENRLRISSPGSESSSQPGSRSSGSGAYGSSASGSSQSASGGASSTTASTGGSAAQQSSEAKRH